MAFVVARQGDTCVPTRAGSDSHPREARLSPQHFEDGDDGGGALARLRARARAQYAIEDEESEEGLSCVGAPIFDKDGLPSHAISLSGPASRFSPSSVTEMGHAIRAAANSISLRLGYTGEASPAKRADPVHYGSC